MVYSEPPLAVCSVHGSSRVPAPRPAALGAALALGWAAAFLAAAAGFLALDFFELDFLAAGMVSFLLRVMNGPSAVTRGERRRANYNVRRRAGQKGFGPARKLSA